MKFGKLARPAVAATLFILAGAAGAQGLALLNAVSPGQWDLHEIGVPGSARSVCIRNPQVLLQLEHAASACDRAIISDGPKSATVRYACPGQGKGLTTLSVESSSIIRLHTQGIIKGAPFDLDYEGRRTGPCA